MATTVQLDYTVPWTGTKSMSDTASALLNVVLPFPPNPEFPYSYFGIQLISDTVSTLVSSVRRSLQFSLPPLNFASTTRFSPVAPFPFNNWQWSEGCVVSSSPNDTVGGTGTERVKVIGTVIRTDPSTLTGLTVPVPFSQELDMNGTTPVNIKTKGIIVTADVMAVKTGVGGSDGQISIWTALDGRARPDARLINVEQSSNPGQIAVNNWQGSIQSTSDEDRFGMGGCEQVQFGYVNRFNAVFGPEFAPLFGTTPVNLVNLNHCFINQAPLLQGIGFGSQGMNIGTITIYSGLNGTGCPMAQIPPGMASAFPVLAPATDIGYGPFIRFYDQLLSAGIGSPVVSTVTFF